MEKSMGATGNVILHRLSEIGTEIEITAEGGIVARITGPDGETIQGRGTLCSLSALTNMLLRGDAQKILRPSGAKRWESE
jgi:antitoxin (DNA-binding transcriptional repressor) of toxin-antitoxin stability system